MKNCVPLKGPWHINYAEPMAGKYLGFHKPVKYAGWIPAQVPGDCHLDLMRAGRITDPFFGLNSDNCVWMEDKDWWYRTEFKAPSHKAGQRLFLVFEGLDTLASVYLNGEKIGAHRNMFTPLRLDITRKTNSGRNLLVVCLGSTAFVPGIQATPRTLTHCVTRRLFFRKAQSSFGWDIAPRLVTVGIWKPARLEIVAEAEIADAWVRTRGVSPESATVDVETEIRRHGPAKPIALEIKLAGQSRRVHLAPAGNISRVREHFTIPYPKLWWPHDLGAPSLYDFTVALKANGRTLDRHRGKFGIRTVELVQEPQGRGKSSFSFRINGRPVFVKGMNWTPADAIYARITDARYAKLVKAAKNANVNALRVWGGGIYEKDIFYELCDREGILVWQDFMFACGMYPQDRRFLAEAGREAEYQVRRLRRHPCLALWCGDNECGWGAKVHYDKNGYERQKLDGRVLPSVCARLCPDVPFIPTTPFSPNLPDHNSPRQGTVHLWAHGKSYKSDFYLKRRPRFVAEIGHISMPDMEAVRAFIPKNALWPVFNEYWRVHSSDAVRCQWNNRLQTMFDSIKARGWRTPKSLAELIARTQRLQAEATRTWIRHFASDPECCGVFLWNLADCWPQVSDAYIAYPFAPKPAFAAVREEYGKIRR